MQVPLVGTFFRPFGKRLLENLPSGTELTLVPEPSNPYDANAIAVFVDPKAAPDWEDLMEESSASGLTEEDWEEPFHIGYVAKTRTAEVRELPPSPVDEAENLGWKGTLGFAPDGKPTITLTVEAK